MVEDANFDMARFGECWLSRIDFTKAKGLQSATHNRASSIDLETLLHSKGRAAAMFFRRAGVPSIVIDYLDSLAGQPLEFHSCFISYSSADELFARVLYHDLIARDVRCWLFAEDAKWGERVWGEIDRSIKVHDKVIVICSRNSLVSGPVLREIERALQREDSERRDVLYPVRIDDFMFTDWQHDRKADVISKVVGDFRDWSKPAKYRSALTRLLETLGKAKTSRTAHRK